MSTTNDVSIDKSGELFGHPKGLFVLFFAEMWERFCYYGMRGLLTVYLIDIFLKGDAEAFAIYGTYTALVYMAPVLGGKIADNFLGYRNAVILGGILMAIGEFLLLGKTDFSLYLGMAAIIVGNGYFKANISSIVGKLYKDGDERKDSGFTIFYIGINVGALLATTVCVEVGRKVGYEYGFGLAGLGMIIGTLIFMFGKKSYQHAAQPPSQEKLHRKIFGPLTTFHVIIVGSLLLIPVIYMLIQFNQIMSYLLLAVAVYVVYTLMKSAIKEGPIWRDRMILMLIIFVFNIVFWACFEQAGTSLTLFARRNVDRMIGGWEMSDATTQFFNPLYIIIFGSIFSMLWIALQKRKMNPSIPMKFGLGIIQLGLGYLVVMFSSAFLSTEYLIPLWSLALLYLLHTTGELFLSPIGLSMVTKLAPKQIVGTAMGGWFLSFAFSNYLAAVIATATGTEGHTGGNEDGPENYQQYITAIDEINASLIVSCDSLVVYANELKANEELFKSDDENSIKVPTEVQNMAGLVLPTYQALQENVYSMIKDSTTYKGDKKLNFTQLAENYYKAASSLQASVASLNKLSGKIIDGTKYEEVKDEFGGYVVGIGNGLESVNSGVISIISRNNEGVSFDPSKDALEKFDDNYARVASHMYWNIYSHVYTLIGYITVAIGLLLCLISRPLTKLLHGIE